jgi:hypothetical protein
MPKKPKHLTNAADIPTEGASSVSRWARRRMQPPEAENTAWHELQLDEDVRPELLDLAEKQLAGELTSHDALGDRLTTIIAFAGALLAVAVTLSSNAAKAYLHHGARTTFSIFFVLAVALLLAAVVRALAAIRPHRRPVPNPDLLRHYAHHRTSTAEMRADAFRQYGIVLQAVEARNDESAHAARASLLLIGAALLAAAVAALIIYFGTPWSTTPPTRMTPQTRTSRIPARPSPGGSSPRPSRRSGSPNCASLKPWASSALPTTDTSLRSASHSSPCRHAHAASSGSRHARPPLQPP